MIVPTGEGDRYARCDGAPYRVARAPHGVPGGDARPRDHAGVRRLDARGAFRYALALAALAAGWRFLVWLSWGVWAVMR